MNFPTNIRIAVLRRFNTSARGPSFIEPWPGSNVADRTQFGIGRGGRAEIRVW